MSVFDGGVQKACTKKRQNGNGEAGYGARERQGSVSGLAGSWPVPVDASSTMNLGVRAGVVGMERVAAMRTVQVSIHVECFNDQVPKGWNGDTENRQSIHVYCDARNFSEALMGAVAETIEKRGQKPWARLDSVTNADDDEFSRKLSHRLEPGRIVDYADMKLIGECLKDESQEGDSDDVSE